MDNHKSSRPFGLSWPTGQLIPDGLMCGLIHLGFGVEFPDFSSNVIVEDRTHDTQLLLKARDNSLLLLLMLCLRLRLPSKTWKITSCLPHFSAWNVQKHNPFLLNYIDQNAQRATKSSQPTKYAESTTAPKLAAKRQRPTRSG
jgi:hypothetical protein